MCRDLDKSSLKVCGLGYCLQYNFLLYFKGIIFDFACGAHSYCLNREPREFEYIRFLVDSAHYRGHKKMKRNTNRSIGGHSGCSEGSN